jgi:hypothetical protein
MSNNGKELFTVGPKRNVSINIGSVRRLNLDVKKLKNTYQIQFNARTNDGFSLQSLKVISRNKEINPPSPIAVIYSPIGNPVGKVTFKYG